VSEDPTTIGRYRIDAALGRGAMGVVYRAHDPEIDRPVAIKLVRADLLEGDERAAYVARFRREAQAAARCTHPNVVTIYDFATHAGNPFLAMEYVDGVSLARGRGAALEPAEAVFLIGQVLDALTAAHAMGVVHRDIKPANILLVGGRTVKVTDFGISRFDSAELTQDGATIGTPSYMSPEQCRGGAVDARSDLFSTGAVLYELLCGVRPFPGRTITDVMQKVLHEDAVDPASLGIALPPALRAVLDRAMAKAPTDRFASATEMAAALRAGVAAPAPAPPLPHEIEDRTVVLAPGAAAATRTGLATGTGTSGGFDQDLLGTVERRLAHYVGPIARYLVQNAIRQADGVDALAETLAGNIDKAADREAFRREIRRLGDPGRIFTPTLVPAVSIAEAERALATRELARSIGPVASLLVKREAAAAVSVADFWQRLSSHIDGAAERAAFLARRDRG
jgi:serine/threonine-protein kinase